MNKAIAANYARLKLSLFVLPLLSLIALIAFLYSQDAFSAQKYIQVQKGLFYFLNEKLSQFPILEYNLTQVGDACIFMSLLAILVVYAPKIWEALLSASLVSCLFCCTLKKFFAVPRPAAALDQDCFVIIGKTLSAHNSLPSGHSITIFTTLAALMYAFMPKRLAYKALWFFLVTVAGLVLVSSRVGVGAHYPLDVIIGSIIGYISGLLGIFISRKYGIWTWINKEKYYPVFILLFLAFGISVLIKMIDEPLAVYYFAFLSLLVSQYKIIRVYVKRHYQDSSLRLTDEFS